MNDPDEELAFMKYQQDLLHEQLEYLSDVKVKEKYRSILQYYIGHGAALINQYLRIEHDKNTGKMPSMITSLDRLFKKIPPISKDIVVYRGIHSSYEINANFSEKAYTSTSLNEKIGRLFTPKQGCCLLKINIPKGFNCTTFRCASLRKFHFTKKK
jgi:ADP-ribosyltransferase exoenzyme